MFLTVQFLVLFFLHIHNAFLSLYIHIVSYSITHHYIDDDLQLQLSAPLDKISKLLSSMQSCASDIKALGASKMDKLKDDGTKLMLVASKRTKHLQNMHTSITIGNV